MNAAQVTSWADGPRYTRVAEPPAPTADQAQLRVVAAGAHNLVRQRAAGTHYSAHTLPHTPGVDAVARDDATGDLYYILGFGGDFGTFAERVNVARPGSGLTVRLPAGVDPVVFAASVNPAASGWLALRARVVEADLPKDWTCLVLGATSASGRLAAQAAHTLGAARVVGAGRNEEALRAVPGLDDVVVFRDPIAETDFNSVAADVVLDYVYGDVTQHFIASLKSQKPVQYIQVGTLSGKADISLPGPLLRSTNLTIRGAGIGSWTMPQLVKELPALVEAMAGWPALEATAVPLKDIETAWNDKSLQGRVVYIP